MPSGRSNQFLDIALAINTFEHMKYILSTLFVFFVTKVSHCQRLNPVSPAENVTPVNIDPKTLAGLQKQYNTIGAAIQSKSQKLLSFVQHQEVRLQGVVAAKNSTKAAQLFGSAAANYKALQDRVSSVAINGETEQLKEYIPDIDSVENALNFLEQKNIQLPADELRQVKALNDQILQLKGRVQQANEVQLFVAARQQQLKDQLSAFGIGKDLLRSNKRLFYYQQQIIQYKSLLKDKDNLQSTLVSTVKRLPAFNEFMQKNSFLAKLYPASQNAGTVEGLAGLQTIADIKKQLQDRFGKDALTPAGAGSASPLQGQVLSAQTGLSKLKDKLNAIGGNNSDLVMPGFTVNQQKNKSFLKRLEYGVNLQSLPGINFLPATSDIGLTLGYKLNDKATIGTGVSYIMGWGNGLSHIHISSQGLGLRSFVDIRAKGSIWVTAAWEYSYYQAFSKLSDLGNNVNAWQKSALIGLTKKYKIGKQNGNMQLLYNLLASQQAPRIPALKFRIGYSF